jgi:hypothetical protein
VSGGAFSETLVLDTSRLSVPEEPLASPAEPCELSLSPMRDPLKPIYFDRCDGPGALSAAEQQLESMSSTFA